jgi:uncharacterized protein YbaP (TraB family)
MDNKKVTNLLRAVADLMDQATEVVVETQKEVTKTVEKSQEDFLTHSLKLMKRIEDNDAIRAYQNKLGKTNKSLADALAEIQKMREQAISDMIKESQKASNPMDLMSQVVKSSEKFGKQLVEESKIMADALKG